MMLVRELPLRILSDTISCLLMRLAIVSLICKFFKIYTEKFELGTCLYSGVQLDFYGMKQSFQKITTH